MKFFAVLLFLCVGAVVSTGPRRSPRWDAHLEHLRSKRDASSSNWQSRLNSPGGCTLYGSLNAAALRERTMVNDALGRRASGVLIEPSSQGSCGSCWAVAAAHTYTDALRLDAQRRNMPLPGLLSAQHPASCYSDTRYVVGGNGCCGASVHAGFQFFRTEGALFETCAPYSDTLSSWRKPDNEPKPPISQTCPATCADNTLFQPEALRLRGYRKLNTEQGVINALQTTPVLVGFDVTMQYRDYVCGVFCQDNNYDRSNVDGHAVEIVDYGNENGVNFWVIKNSWGMRHGEAGYFRIRRGDLYMSSYGYFAPVLSADQEVSSSSTGLAVCAIVDVSNPEQNELVMSAVEHVIDELNERGGIACGNGSTATSVTFASVQDADLQGLESVFIDLMFEVNLLGCSEGEQAAYNASVVLSPENTFSTTFVVRLSDDTSGVVKFASSCFVVLLAGLVAIMLF